MNTSLNQMITELRSTAQVAGNKPVGKVDAAAGGADFGEALKNAIEQVNAAQQEAQKMSEGFITGSNTEANLQDVMIASQKASLSFQQMVQVRNKLVNAYQDIMNMSV
ncbi:MAG: flagellar hook-basal body complex protein FliE [Methyloversatilis sp.]|jgi:flagellar hook-basal body complex protein FliE|uniref:Flagellar hook-basal body complex protein FliE n=1 Tax=Methyloversatilis universalis (strain ATCC BAA-1314 / DSM 25237 / JCM 13912 / CCUG 52030 / FAM5) TaxID=1000565 RepID=F5R7U6_METUF|nr:flagellar hook-basal body complex protein FliE [Methyloversatilis universalis]EGK73157.1 Putative Flagellar hook-basal body complex protein FliE [Methyloversatilis universalis FAM5]MCP4636924.1 flagellar hook-basal body complex protein FliE [Methyloversatilis sp.]